METVIVTVIMIFYDWEIISDSMTETSKPQINPNFISGSIKVDHEIITW